MSVKNFKFVSPGVFINEIDNSFIPKAAEAIGPVVIGRSQRGLGMTPIKVESYSEFVEMFGDTVPGNAGGDISRYGNFQSPMYGTYAAKAFLNANVAPLTYVRLLGQQDSAAEAGTAGPAGWETLNDATVVISSSGGAYGLWVWNASSSVPNNVLPGTGSLAAVFYVNSGSSVYLSGTVCGTGSIKSASNSYIASPIQEGVGVVIASTSDGLFTTRVTGTLDGVGTSTKFTFGFDDSQENFMRKVFNTNPQLASNAGTFYPAASRKTYWLGESYEQTLRDNSQVGSQMAGVILPIALTDTPGTGPHDKRQGSQEGKTGWVISQDVGNGTGYSPESMTKLFQLKGRGHGGWLHKNCKVTIERVRRSTLSTSDYGSFSVVIRRLSDHDGAQEVMERFDLCDLDPTSTNFVARRIGDKYTSWDATARRLKEYGDYPNQSKFVYIVMNSDVEAGAVDPVLLPFGYYGPPRFSGSTDLTTGSANVTYFYSGSTNGVGLVSSLGIGDLTVGAFKFMLSGAVSMQTSSFFDKDLTGSLIFPTVRLRASSSDGGLSDPTVAAFGMQTTRTATDTTFDPSVADFHNLLKRGFSGGGGDGSADGIENAAYVFTLDDVCRSGSTSTYFWRSGSRAGGTSVSYSGSYTTLLDAGYDSFTMPFFGGFDGFDIKVPDPMYNGGIPSSPTNQNSSIYNTWRRAMDTVADPEAINMNMLCPPGLTQTGLTAHAVNVCEERADALALIDLPSVYLPGSEQYDSGNKSNRIGTTPQAAATALRNRRMDSSYGCTFYPWVQTRDEASGRLVWLPPSVAMMGVLASSERSSAIWFAPAGFNRGGLTDGAAGIPVLQVSERLTSKQRDTLYESNINPIASFPSTGIVVFGQKTLQERQSALDRINVRRLVIFLKKQISILSTRVLFEQNVTATWDRFKALIEPLLMNTKTGFGITDYRLILDETTSTPDLIDQNILYAKIMIKPARAIEYIAIDFVIMNTGASFDD
jgi:hypothetical protein